MQLPAAPAAWQHFAIILRLTAVDARDGTEQRLPDAAPGSVAVLPIGRHTATVIIAEPVVVGPAGAGSRGAPLPPEGALRLRPAGALVPLDIDGDGVLQVTWERGVLAALILDLWRGGATRGCSTSSAWTGNCGNAPAPTHGRSIAAPSWPRCRRAR